MVWDFPGRVACGGNETLLGASHSEGPVWIMFMAVLVSLAGIFLAYMIYAKRSYLGYGLSRKTPSYIEFWKISIILMRFTISQQAMQSKALVFSYLILKGSLSVAWYPP